MLSFSYPWAIHLTCSDLSLFSHLGELFVWVQGSVPVHIFKGSKPKDLECVFSGRPLPRQVSWYMNGELISNGTNGIYHSEDWKDGNLHTKLSLPAGREEQKGFYTCTAMNNISGWSSSASKKIQIKYHCKLSYLTFPLGSSR